MRSSLLSVHLEIEASSGSRYRFIGMIGKNSDMRRLDIYLDKQADSIFVFIHVIKTTQGLGEPRIDFIDSFFQFLPIVIGKQFLIPLLI